MDVSAVMIRKDILSRGGRMPPKLGYVIVYVADMDRAVAFYRDTLASR